MKIALLFLISACIAHATSYLISLQEKLAYACIIAQVKVTEIDRDPKPENPMAYTVFTCEIEELFEGPSPKVLKFRSHSYGHLEDDKLDGLVGQKFIIFLHDPYKNKKYWLFEGPRGMRPLSESYTEWHIPSEELTTDTYTHADYIAILRAIPGNKSFENTEIKKKKIRLTRHYRQ